VLRALLIRCVSLTLPGNAITITLHDNATAAANAPCSWGGRERVFTVGVNQIDAMAIAADSFQNVNCWLLTGVHIPCSPPKLGEGSCTPSLPRPLP